MLLYLSLNQPPQKQERQRCLRARSKTLSPSTTWHSGISGWQLFHTALRSRLYVNISEDQFRFQSVLFQNFTWYDNIRTATKVQPFLHIWNSSYSGPLDFALYLLGLVHTLDSWLISASATLLRTANSLINISAVLIIKLFTDKAITDFLISGFNVTHVYLL